MVDGVEAPVCVHVAELVALSQISLRKALERVSVWRRVNLGPPTRQGTVVQVQPGHARGEDAARPKRSIARGLTGRCSRRDVKGRTVARVRERRRTIGNPRRAMDDPRQQTPSSVGARHVLKIVLPVELFSCTTRDAGTEDGDVVDLSRLLDMAMEHVDVAERARHASLDSKQMRATRDLVGSPAYGGEDRRPLGAVPALVTTDAAILAMGRVVDVVISVLDGVAVGIALLEQQPRVRAELVDDARLETVDGTVVALRAARQMLDPAVLKRHVLVAHRLVLSNGRIELRLKIREREPAVVNPRQGSAWTCEGSLFRIREGRRPRELRKAFFRASRNRWNTQ